ncbi:transmembrane protein 269 isoform X2 [Erinaceus europaeus]|uniref:Transmembrane protein 269 isoform X2 n=1 Tax=Erinaceus europaeus TaxID=9365 RepID=A0ABM3YLX3_ERIEU|nr:transmembrane protein 269 isoform X2 [Erinaceus europaeus]
MPHLGVTCCSKGISTCTEVTSLVLEKADKIGDAKYEVLQGQCNSFSMTSNKSHSQGNDFSWNDLTNALSLANMILGICSIFCTLCKKPNCACWMLLISFLLDIAVGAIARQLSICSKSGVELSDFAAFTTFGLASALLIGVDGPLNGFLATIYVLAISFRLCFYSSGEWNPDVPFTHKGLPCPYASCVLASTSLLTKGNTFVLSCMASLMILFMMDQSYYPHDKILESENWKKMVYLGGIVLLFLSPFSLTPFYCLLWSLSYIFFPDVLWGQAACYRLQH